MLADLLRRTVCPTPQQTLFLRGCLHGDLRAWEQWRASVSDPKSELGNDTIGIKRLVPLLYTSLRDSGAELDAEFLSYLRAAYVREDLRARTFRRVGGEGLAALTQAGIPFIVLKGVSLAGSDYPAWALRHCHDVDLLAERIALKYAIATLNDFRVFSRHAGNVTVVHETNLPISFHTRLFEFYDNPTRINEQSVETEIMGVRARVLVPHHELLHVCVHAASGPSCRMLLWVADAIHLLRHTPSLDWKAFVEAAKPMALPAYVMLRYLRDEMGGDIPAFVLEELAKHGGQQRVSVLKGLIGIGGYRALMKSARGRERVAVWGWGVSQIPRVFRRRLRRK